MYYFETIAIVLFFISLTSNLFLLNKLSKLKKNPDLTTHEILADILKGNALVRIERIAPESVFLKRW
jgi:hypothetical protein